MNIKNLGSVGKLEMHFFLINFSKIQYKFLKYKISNLSWYMYQSFQFFVGCLMMTPKQNMIN